MDIGGREVTYGFECEFKSGINAQENVIKILDKKTLPRLDWLDKNIGKETTGNTEVRSKVSKDLNLQLERMEILNKMLGSEMRGFHLHLRIGMGVFADKYSAEKVLGWLGRFGDMVLLWRLQNFDPKWALTQYSQVRVDMNWLKGDESIWKGVIRGFKIDNSYDIEIRGLMSYVNMFRKVVPLLIKRLQNPEILKGYYEWQSLSMEVDKQEKLTAFFNRYMKKQLDSEQKDLLNWLELYSTADEWKHPKRGAKTKHGRENIILYGFEKAPFFDEKTQELINQNNLLFCKDLDVLLKKKIADKSLIVKQYHLLMKKWAKNIKLYEKLFQSL
ncbi:MAG: hypothetical protein H0U27_05050 [Nitrosopumilus sp.]|nr:hypothetical protein [Nitrosopumilus sp.]